VTFTSLLDFLLTMVLTFYLLQHGGELWQSLVEWLPTRFRAPSLKQSASVFKTFSSPN
jgi:predicted PurR-regulated permease PerM